MKTLVTLLLSLASVVAFAAEPTTLVIPKITKPLVEPVENDPLQADYDKMWAEYEEAIKAATAKVTEALDRQSTKAAESGDLDFVEVWEEMKKKFVESAKLEWDTSSKASLSWRKKYPKVPFPRDFSEAVRSASSLIENARGILEDSYAELVKSYTKAKNIQRAKELREEGTELFAKHRSSSKDSSGAQRTPLQAKAEWVALITDPDAFKLHWEMGNPKGQHSYDPDTGLIVIDSTDKLGTLKDGEPWGELYFEMAVGQLSRGTLNLEINGVIFKLGDAAMHMRTKTPVRVVFDEQKNLATVIVGQIVASKATITDSKWRDHLLCKFSTSAATDNTAKVVIGNIRACRPPKPLSTIAP